MPEAVTTAAALISWWYQDAHCHAEASNNTI